MKAYAGRDYLKINLAEKEVKITKPKKLEGVVEFYDSFQDSFTKEHCEINHEFPLQILFTKEGLTIDGLKSLYMNTTQKTLKLRLPFSVQESLSRLENYEIVQTQGGEKFTINVNIIK